MYLTIPMSTLALLLWIPARMCNLPVYTFCIGALGQVVLAIGSSSSPLPRTGKTSRTPIGKVESCDRLHSIIIVKTFNGGVLFCVMPMHGVAEQWGHRFHCHRLVLSHLIVPMIQHFRVVILPGNCSSQRALHGGNQLCTQPALPLFAGPATSQL